MNLKCLGILRRTNLSGYLPVGNDKWFLPNSFCKRKFHTTAANEIIKSISEDSWRIPKEKFLDMDVEEKRQFYYVKGNYLDVDRMRPWPVYFEHMKVPKTTKKRKYPVKFPINYKISMGKANLIALEVDAIVNSASRDLMGNGGELDRLVHTAAGKELLLECKTLRGCEVGVAKLTGGYRLPARYIIHTVGPTKENPAQLNACYKSCLNLMLMHRFTTMGFPCISTVSNNFPAAEAAHIALKAVRQFLEKHFNEVERVGFAIHRDEDLKVYQDLMQVYFPCEEE